MIYDNKKSYLKIIIYNLKIIKCFIKIKQKIKNLF